MGVNFWGVVHGTKEFLPHLKAAGEGHVVNISSVFGLLSIPSQSAYNAAKFGVRGFTDALRIELDLQRCGVSATTVHPGGIRTNIVRNARLDPATSPLGGDNEAAAAQFARAARTTPESAALQILAAVQRNRRRALIGPDAVVFDAISRLPAGVAQRIVGLGSRVRR
jgi:butyryl-CoA dehydrogenase